MGKGIMCMREKNAVKNLNRDFLLLAVLIFFAATALLRAVNILFVRFSTQNDVAYLVSEIYSFAKATAVTVSYAFAISAIFFAVKKNGKLKISAPCGFFAVIFADRLFCLVWDLATSNITLGEKNTLADAVRWLLTDVLYFAAAFFAAALIARLSCTPERNISSAKGIMFSSGVLAVLQLISRVVICIQFMAEYDDVTATEYSQMAGDVLLVILRYGIFMGGVATVFNRLISYTVSKKNKKIGDAAD